MSSETVIERNGLWIILVVGLVLRMSIPIVALYLTPDDGLIFHNKDDTMSYVQPARGLVNHGKFVSDGIPELNRTPAYPLLLVPGVLLGNVELVTVGIQVLLSCLTILLVYGITKVLFDDQRVAVFSACLYALDPLSLIQTSILQTETFFACAFSAFLFFVLRYLKYSSMIDLLVAGLLSSLCAFIRPAAYFMPLFVTLFLFLWALIKTRRAGKPLIHVFLFLLLAMGPLFAWQVRNKIETGTFVFSTNAGYSLYYGAGAQILAYESGISVADQMHNMGINDFEIYLALHPEQRKSTETAVDNYQRQEALKIIVTHPFLFLRMFALKTVWILVGPGLSDWLYVFNVRQDNMDKVLENRRDPLRLLKGPWLGLIGTFLLASILAGYWVLAATGLIVWRPGTTECILLLLILAAYYVLLPAVMGLGYSRYRHPIMPIICVFAGNGLAMILDKWATRRYVPNNT